MIQEDAFSKGHVCSSLKCEEFLTAEYCLQRCHESHWSFCLAVLGSPGGDFIYEMRNLICPVEPQQILERGAGSKAELLRTLKTIN